MITVNTYWICERAVNHGVAEALERLIKDPTIFSKPDEVINAIAGSVMEELTSVFEFGITPVRLTKDITVQLAQLSQQQPQE